MGAKETIRKEFGCTNLAAGELLAKSKSLSDAFLKLRNAYSTDLLSEADGGVRRSICDWQHGSHLPQLRPRHFGTRSLPLNAHAGFAPFRHNFVFRQLEGLPSDFATGWHFADDRAANPFPLSNANWPG